ncbi:sugar ABC transporter permease [Aerococcaceae bacterium INB8]|uniref:Sugar ABC transporter permease n=1 Tax=Ruoffia halotolerans TaxID=2748684 RepID=A0A839A3L0_9LACT|nr:sugar ABC transporter permease [Ruoffia halotolerans]MBA5728430.1 sugar ABC transporter permease [Ruoffia halotolerans]
MYINRKTKWSAFLLFLPFLIAFVLFWLIPFSFGVFTSLHQYSVFAGNQGFVGLNNYQTLIQGDGVFGSRFYLGMGNTLIFVVFSVIPLVLISLGLALTIHNLNGWVKNIFRTIFFISYGVSVTAVSSIFKWLFNGNGGYINQLLSEVNLPAIQWLNQQPYAWAVIIVTTVWWTVGYNMILFSNALDNLDPALYEAASIDGANAWDKFRHITLPSIKNITMFVILTTVIASFNLYGQSLLITGGGPAQSTMSVIMVIQQTIFNQNNLGMGSAMAVLLGIIIMLVSVIQLVVERRGEQK